MKELKFVWGLHFVKWHDTYYSFTDGEFSFLYASVLNIVPIATLKGDVWWETFKDTHLAFFFDIFFDD